MPTSPSLSCRPAAVAGQFYPAEAASLSRTVNVLLGSARASAPRADRAAHGQSEAAPKALIAPHAGYIYSGPIAANAYARLTPLRSVIERVVLLGPTHRVAVRGLAIPSVGRFATPLGTVELDTEAIETLKRLPQVVVNDEAHALEHALEVHLPFLQTVLDAFKLVPLAVGDASADAVAEVLDAVWGGPETLIVVSSDLSHYLSYGDARTVDRDTTDAILALRTDIGHEQACGATPVCGLTLAARRRKLRPELLDARNSGDTAGDKKRVVGYASFAFYPES